MAGLETKIVSIETAAPLRDKILSDSILNLQATLSRIAMPMVPNFVLAPGYGAAQVSAVAPVVTNGTATPTTAASAA